MVAGSNPVTGSSLRAARQRSEDCHAIARVERATAGQRVETGASTWQAIFRSTGTTRLEFSMPDGVTVARTTLTRSV